MEEERAGGEMALVRRKDEVGGQDRSCIDQETRNMAHIKVVPYHLNGRNLSWDELRENIKL